MLLFVSIEDNSEISWLLEDKNTTILSYSFRLNILLQLFVFLIDEAHYKIVFTCSTKFSLIKPNHLPMIKDDLTYPTDPCHYSSCKRFVLFKRLLCILLSEQK